MAEIKLLSGLRLSVRGESNKKHLYEVRCISDSYLQEKQGLISCPLNEAKHFLYSEF